MLGVNVMQLINNYKLEKQGNEYVLLVYLNQYDTEFADEFGHIKEEKKRDFTNYIRDFVREKFPGKNISLCKVMIGSMLVGTLFIAGGQLQSAKAAEQNTGANYTITVQAGDSLWKIANRTGVSIDRIKATNQLTSDTIYINQLLKIPSTSTGVTNGTYQVKAGDSLYKIATAYGTSVEKLKASNNLTKDIIYPGQQLIIPGQQTTPTQPTPTQPNTGQPGETNSSYKVQAGDSLWKISQKFGLSVNQLKSLNNLTSDTIYTGQILVIKGDVDQGKEEATVSYTSHTVKAGDTLWSISIDYGIPMNELAKANGLATDSYLSIGETIRVPVHHIPVKPTPGDQYGEYLDWWSEARYIFAVNDTARITDMETGRSFMIKRTTGANHADCEPLTAKDVAVAKDIWGGYSWNTRAVLVQVDGRKIAGSMSFMPHDVQYITDNNFNGHFDVHFLNSTRHKDGQIDERHQEKINIAAGIR